MVAAFGTARDTRFDDIPRLETVEQLALPALAPASEPDLHFLREERVRRGDTVMDLLQRLGIDDPAAFAFLKGNATSQTLFRQLSPGKNLTARTGAHGELQSLVFPLNGGKDQALVVERQGERFSASEQPLRLETQVVMKTAEIRYSLLVLRTPPASRTRSQRNWPISSAGISISTVTCAKATDLP